jgi:hypothetical protein
MSRVTRLRISTTDGSIHMGSGEVVSARPQEGTSASGSYTADELHGIQPYASFDDYVKDTMSPQYKGNWQNPREAEAFRELCAKRLARTEQIAVMGQRLSSGDDAASQIVAADPSIPMSIAQRAAPFNTKEERAKAYANPLYKTSEDYRAEVSAKDALTDF